MTSTVAVPEATATIEEQVDLTIPSASIVRANTIDELRHQYNIINNNSQAAVAATGTINISSSQLVPLDDSALVADSIPATYAVPLADNHIDDDLEAQNNKEKYFGGINEFRPEFISVSVSKPTPEFPVGISLMKKHRDGGHHCDDGILLVSAIHDTSLLLHSPVEVDDEIIRINGIDCRDRPVAFAIQLIKDARDHVTIVVKNHKGDGNPRVVWNHAMKPSTNSSVGVSLIGTNGDIRVNKLTSNAMLADAILRVGDRILAINGANCTDPAMTAREAVALIRTSDSSDGVLVVTETKAPESRPGFVSVTVIKQTETTKMGIGFQAMDGDVRVTSLVPFSALCNSPIMVGDKIVSINNAACTPCTKTTHDYLSSLVGPVTITVQVDEGNPNLVATMLTKPSSDARIGITLEQQRGGVYIRSIDPNGRLVNSLLNVGDRVVSVNDHDCDLMNAQEVLDLLRNSPESVTIVTRTTQTTGVVLSAGDSIVMNHHHHQQQPRESRYVNDPSLEERRQDLNSRYMCCFVVFLFVFVAFVVYFILQSQ